MWWIVVATVAFAATNGNLHGVLEDAKAVADITMTALCFNCGAKKFGSYNRCSACDMVPTTGDATSS